MLRSVVRIGSIVVLLAGALFFFQGIGVVPGSFMTGRSEWAFIGAAMVGLAVLAFWLSRALGRAG
jgi:hypothetical protein